MTEEELATKYVARIRAAAGRLSLVQKTAAVLNEHEKLASSRVDAVAEVLEVFGDIDGLVYSSNQAAVPAYVKGRILQLVDGELGLTPGTCWMLKEGSLAKQIDHQKLILQMLATAK